jgi:small-conductance mechanosensitive channel
MEKVLAEFFQNWMPAAKALGALVISGLIGLGAHFLVFSLIRRLTRRTPSPIDDAFIKHCRGPLKLLFPLLALSLFLPVSSLPDNLLSPLRHLISVGVIVSVTWLLIRGTSALEEALLARFPIDERDNLRARKFHTQLQILRKTVVFVLVILAFAAVLMTFDKVRQLGTAILASAGIVGIVLGFATQKTISTVLAGLQIAITQPIRVDDVVIVGNEWGRIEEISLTYVVVRIWDLRRLVVPITYFIEKPFQNWTRVSADLLGSVFIYADYTLPVQRVREELHSILKGSSLWDGRVWGLQVTGTTERAVELRALMSAPDASSAWDLRCKVREKLLEFIQRNYPESLPRLRADLASGQGIRGE